LDTFNLVLVSFYSKFVNPTYGDQKTYDLHIWICEKSSDFAIMFGSIKIYKISILIVT